LIFLQQYFLYQNKESITYKRLKVLEKIHDFDRFNPICRKETIERNNRLRQQMKDMILQDRNVSSNYLKEHLQHCVDRDALRELSRLLPSTEQGSRDEHHNPDQQRPLSISVRGYSWGSRCREFECFLFPLFKP